MEQPTFVDIAINPIRTTRNAPKQYNAAALFVRLIYMKVCEFSGSVEHMI